MRPPFVRVSGLLLQPEPGPAELGRRPEGRAPHLVEEYYDRSGPDKKEVVVLSQVLSDDVNVGFTFDSVGLDYVASVTGNPWRTWRRSSRR